MDRNQQQPHFTLFPPSFSPSVRSSSDGGGGGGGSSSSSSGSGLAFMNEDVLVDAASFSSLLSSVALSGGQPLLNDNSSRGSNGSSTSSSSAMATMLASFGGSGQAGGASARGPSLGPPAGVANDIMMKNSFDMTATASNTQRMMTMMMMMTATQTQVPQTPLAKGSSSNSSSNSNGLLLMDSTNDSGAHLGLLGHTASAAGESTATATGIATAGIATMGPLLSTSSAASGAASPPSPLVLSLKRKHSLSPLMPLGPDTRAHSGTSLPVSSAAVVSSQPAPAKRPGTQAAAAAAAAGRKKDSSGGISSQSPASAPLAALFGSRKPVAGRGRGKGVLKSSRNVDDNDNDDEDDDEDDDEGDDDDDDEDFDHSALPDNLFSDLGDTDLGLSASDGEHLFSDSNLFSDGVSPSSSSTSSSSSSFSYDAGVLGLSSAAGSAAQHPAKRRRQSSASTRKSSSSSQSSTTSGNESEDCGSDATSLEQGSDSSSNNHYSAEVVEEAKDITRKILASADFKLRKKGRRFETREEAYRRILQRELKKAERRENRRVSHIAMEQKRRQHLKERFDDLEKSVPTCKDLDPNMKIARQPYILKLAVEYIGHLESQIDQANQRILEIEQVNRTLSAERRLLTDLGLEKRRVLLEICSRANGFLSYMKQGKRKLYVFVDKVYFRYDLDDELIDFGYPRPINLANWKNIPFTRVDTAVNWGNGKAYLFSGSYYARYDTTTETGDEGYPRLLSNDSFPGLSFTQIDAAVDWGNGKVYFFYKNQYVRYDVALDRQDPGYPKPINDQTWPGVFPEGVQAVLKWNNTRAYFFRNNHYVSYNVECDCAEGDPQPLEITSSRMFFEKVEDEYL